MTDTEAHDIGMAETAALFHCATLLILARQGVPLNADTIAEARQHLDDAMVLVSKREAA